MKTLRTYQMDCVKKVYKSWDKKEDPLLVAPTGAGKTAIAAKILFDKALGGHQLGIIVPRDTLVEQAKKELESWGLDVGIVAGGRKESRRSQVQVISFQSLGSRGLDWFNPKACIIDECHITSFSQSVLRWFPKFDQGVKRCKVLGITATPRRMKRDESLGQIFNKLILAPSIADLIKLGHLVKPSYNICPNLISGKMIYDPSYAFHVFKQIGDDLQTLIFPPNVAACKATERIFKEAGIEAIAITDRTPRKARAEAFARFEAEELKVLISCVVLREGFDSPKATHLIAGFDWNSHSAAIQMYGRVLRPATFKDGTPKTSAIISDICGLVAKHGRAEYIRYSEADLYIPDEPEEGSAPTKQCLDCKAWVFAALPVCPHCGFEFHIEPKRIILPEGDLLQELTDEEINQQKAYQKYLQIAFREGSRPKWAQERFKQEFGFYPPIDWRRNSVLKGKDAIAYRDWLLAANDTSLNWVARQLQLEGILE